MVVSIENEGIILEKNIELQELFEKLLDSIKSDDVVGLSILGFLPTVEHIFVSGDFDNDFISFTFSLGKTLKLYNTGIEDIIRDFFKE